MANRFNQEAVSKWDRLKYSLTSKLRISINRVSAPASLVPSKVIFNAARLVDFSDIEPPKPTTFIFIKIRHTSNSIQDYV